MTRPLAFLAALAAAALAVSSACLAEVVEPIRFTLEPEREGAATIHASFRRSGKGANDDRWSTGVMPSDLIGLEVSSFHGRGTRPLHFALVRDAGRLDCEGTGGGDIAVGQCRFSENSRFVRLVESLGMSAPSEDQAMALMAVNARADLLRSIAAARYPTPRINDVIALAALGVDARYVASLAAVGYRPRTIQKLVEFKAVGITPDWIQGFVRSGYSDVPEEKLVQLRALAITPAFIEGFERIGYRRLPVSTLVQLKALGITPDFVRGFARKGEPLPPINRLVELKTFADRY